MYPYLAIVAILGVVTIAILGALLHKIRRAHKLLIVIDSRTSDIRRELDNIFHQQQAYASLDRLLNLSRSLPPMRGWAGSPDMLLVVAEHIIESKPETIVECSSGVSTIVAARCCELNGRGHVYSLEHDAEYAKKTSEQLGRHNLQTWATVIHTPLTENENQELWYDDRLLPVDLPPIDLVVIDGPPAGGVSTARGPAYSRLRRRLSSSAVIILDDADRPGEQQIVREWLNRDSSLSAHWIPCEKGLAFLKLNASQN